VLFAGKLDGKVNGMLIPPLRIGEVAAKRWHDSGSVGATQPAVSISLNGGV
jgi:hypothetical protein